MIKDPSLEEDERESYVHIESVGTQTYLTVYALCSISEQLLLLSYTIPSCSTPTLSFALIIGMIKQPPVDLY